MRIKSPESMEIDLCEEQEVPSATLTCVKFSFATETEKEKISVLSIDAVSEVTDPKLGLPNPTSQCSTCGAQDLKYCEGHFGVIKFPFTILHPYFLSEVVHVLNQICPGCKSVRKETVKGINLISRQGPLRVCKYCVGSTMGYPAMKFRVSPKEIFKRTTIVAVISEKLSMKSQKKGYKKVVAADYWDVIPKDEHQEETTIQKPNKRVLSHEQVGMLLKGVDPSFFQRSALKEDFFFINYFPVSPNCHRVTEFTHTFSNGQRLMFDERTSAYKKLVDFRGLSNELGYRVMECLKTSKITPDHSININPFLFQKMKMNDNNSNPSGLRWIKDLVLGKRNDHSFRMVVVGDPNLKLDEIGIPCHIAERLKISEILTPWNWKKLIVFFEVGLLEKGEMHVRRQGSLVRVHRAKDLKCGDMIYRPLKDGDNVLINRPPSVHHHSLISFSVKVLPMASVLAINPLCCSPFRADFDGDCLHGYVPQSVDTRIELTELVALNKQLINTQTGRSLLTFSQDSLVASYFLFKDEVRLSMTEVQQLQMICPDHYLHSAIGKASSFDGCSWSGKQLIGMLLPTGFSHDCPSKDVCICTEEFVPSEASLWLRGADGNFFQRLIKHSPSQILNFLHVTQEVLCEWLSMRGLSVSLSDLYLSMDSSSRQNMIDEILFGLQDAEYACYLKHLMVDSCQEFLAGIVDVDSCPVPFNVERMSFEMQRSAALSQTSLDAFKEVFRDIQSLAFKYASCNNSFLNMFLAGSKGNLMKLVQQSMCLGLQHSLVSLSFRIPQQLSCAGWNKQKADDAVEYAKRYIPYAVVESSFLTGLNPAECFTHSLTCRDSSFSDNADLPGTLNRRLMFFMRDAYVAYDGTVRNAYENQIVQFSYKIDEISVQDRTDDVFDNSDVIASQPVGSLAACAISEAAYSALDQPISLLEKSPLLNLKNVLECGLKKGNAHKTMSLFLSKKLGRQRYGFEYGALEVQNHLERLIFSDIVSVARIIFTPRGETCFSPWVCHFHVFKEMVKKRGLKLHSIIDTLYEHCKSKSSIPNVQISCEDCSVVDCVKEKEETFCIAVKVIEIAKNLSVELDLIQGLMLPFLLQTVIKGLMEIKKVQILWNDRPNIKKSSNCHGELYLRVTMSGRSEKTKLWSLLVESCLPIMKMIDWSRSHPDNIREFCLAYGIDAGWKLFLDNMEYAMSDAGKAVLPEHLILAANSLSFSGEFVGLSASGWKRQREHASGSSPFVQAFFSNPGNCFIKAAKAEVKDDLHGCLGALAWGMVPQIGTGHFDIVYSHKGCELSKPTNVYNLLGSQMSLDKHDDQFKMPDMGSYDFDKCGSRSMHKFDCYSSKRFHILESISKSILSRLFTYDDIQRLSRKVRLILNKYPVDHQLNETDKSIVMMALYFHPRRDEKVGTGAQHIKVINHPQFQDTRCFSLVRADGTMEDFSYRKCLHAAFEVVAPRKAKVYHEKYLQSRSMELP